MTYRIMPLSVLVVLGVGLAITPDDVQGCAPVPREGQRVHIADESAFIIWEETPRVEHFIRRATFSADAPDFGFLVPTPSQPEIALADDDLFTELARITEPVTEHRVLTDWSLGCFRSASTEKVTTGEATADGIVVLEQKRVGDLDATVLKFRADKTKNAEDAADALLSWLKRNGYAIRPDLTAWLKPYIFDQWVITAFKMAPAQLVANAPGANAKPDERSKPVGLKSATVRMSFKTERPFFPYREPTYQRDGTNQSARILRVYVAAAKRMTGILGNGSESWPGTTVWANSIAEPERKTLLEKSGKLPASTLPVRWWITEFEDRSSPRPGFDEIYFAPSADLAVVARPPRLTITHRSPGWLGPVVIGVPLVLIVGGIIMWRWAARQPLEKRLSSKLPPLSP